MVVKWMWCIGLCAYAAPAMAQGQHGAASMAEQQAALSKLGFGDGQVVDSVVLEATTPADNKTTKARVALGQKLYFDTRLSADGTVACATCHDVTRSFGDARNSSEGIKDQIGQRNAPTVLNAALLRTQFWDGRAATLEQQAGMPILNPIEMGHKTEADALKGIEGDAEYQAMFKAAYGRKINYRDVERALAAFERTLIALDAPFDRFMAGDATAMSAQAQAGWKLFNGKARCVSCHPITSSNPVGSDHSFHNIGVSARDKDFEKLAARAIKELGTKPSTEKLEELALQSDLSQLGRFVVTVNRADIGSFKTSQLRNIGITGPYMHDGSVQTLWDVIDHYNKGGEANPYLDGGVEPLALSEREVDELVAFMFALTDKRFDSENNQAMVSQRKRADDARPLRDIDLAHRRKIQFEDRVMK